MYKIVIHNNRYTEYDVVDSNTFEKVDIPDLNPIREKLFNNDNFEQ